MSTSVIKTKDQRINKEIRRLKKIFDDVPDKKKDISIGLIKRAAFMIVTLEDYEVDVILNGSVEMFTQSEKQDPYERERPVIRLYNVMNKNYQSISKQLIDLLKNENDNDLSDLLSTINKPQ